MEINHNTCFVIQPFDNGKFDSRFQDIFKPAIEKAGLEAYRVDKDPKVRVPIDDIEHMIRSSVICFADITLDNPNVWYELGFAFACGKDVIMVCSTDERTGSYPFDIRHKTIINYNLSSKRDFTTLEETITSKIKAYSENQISKANDRLISNSTDTRNSLEDYEISLLKILVEEQLSQHCALRLDELRKSFLRLGYDRLQFGIATRSLMRKEFIDCTKDIDGWNNEHDICRITLKGENWILENINKMPQLIVTPSYHKFEEADDLPF